MKALENLGWSVFIVGLVLAMIDLLLAAVLMLSGQWHYHAAPVQWVLGLAIIALCVGFMLIGIGSTAQHINRN
ncbi:MAG TPA: hypothetical protein PKE21_13690 [Flavobacteriales bacterium]|nr:hypothetical protein [Flavobacteriales bacterium]HMR28529.1 hypothetical protein [Flavobacteriales bacterium]